MTAAPPRRGFLALPNALIEALRRDFPVVQRWVIVGLASEANYTPGEVELRGGIVVELDVGETLYSSREFAKRHGIERDDVRRAVKRGEAHGWLACRPAWSASAPDRAPEPAPLPAPSSAPPPTIVRFTKHREILWPNAESAPPPAPSLAPEDAPQSAPIQPGNTVSSSVSDSCAALTRDAGREEEPSAKDRVILRDEVKRFRQELAKRLGVRKVSVATPKNRRRVADEMADWLAREGYSPVLEACVARAYRDAVGSGYHPADSLAWYVEARDDISDAHPAGQKAGPPDLSTVAWGRAGDAPAQGYWAPVVARMTPMQALAWSQEVRALPELVQGDDAARSAAWERFAKDWKRRVGLKEAA